MNGHAVVAGGGIGGLAAAVGLLRAGWEVTVLESAPDFSEVGSGFALTANGVTALSALGLGEETRSLGHPLRAEGTRDVHGRWIARLDAENAPESLRLHGVHRQRLHGMLLAAAHGADLHHSATVHGVEPGSLPGEFARVHVTENGTTRRLSADLVVGADGLRSVVRAGVDPAVRVRYSGMSSWRGIAGSTDLIGDAFRAYWGPAAEFGALRIDQGEIYWYGYVRLPEHTDFSDELDAALTRFADWAEPVPALIAATDPRRLLRHDVYELSPTAHRIAAGRVVLLGDAAHAMLPTMGQGVNTALEDAATLGRVVRPGELIDGVARYSAERYGRTRGIQRRSAMMARIGSHLSNPAAVAARNGLMRLAPVGAMASSSSRIFDWLPPAPLPDADD